MRISFPPKGPKEIKTPVQFWISGLTGNKSTGLRNYRLSIIAFVTFQVWSVV